MTTKQKTEREVLEMALVGYNQQLEAVEQKIAEVKGRLSMQLLSLSKRSISLLPFINAEQRRRKKLGVTVVKVAKGSGKTPSLGAKAKKGRK